MTSRLGEFVEIVWLNLLATGLVLGGITFLHSLIVADMARALVAGLAEALLLISIYDEDKTLSWRDLFQACFRERGP